MSKPNDAKKRLREAIDRASRVTAELSKASPEIQALFPTSDRFWDGVHRAAEEAKKLPAFKQRRLGGHQPEPKETASPAPQPHNLDDILDEAARTRPATGRPCRCCENPVARDLLLRYFERKDAGEDMPGLNWLHQQAIEPRFHISYDAVKRHIRNCLGRR